MKKIKHFYLEVLYREGKKVKRESFEGIKGIKIEKGFVMIQNKREKGDIHNTWFPINNIIKIFTY